MMYVTVQGVIQDFILSGREEKYSIEGYNALLDNFVTVFMFHNSLYKSVYVTTSIPHAVCLCVVWCDSWDGNDGRGIPRVSPLFIIICCVTANCIMMSNMWC